MSDFQRARERAVYEKNGVGEYYREENILPAAVTLHEVGPRDGLQNEVDIIETNTKLELIHLLIDAGLRRIEAGSFVSPKWVPQMADTLEVFDALRDCISIPDVDVGGNDENECCRESGVSRCSEVSCVTPSLVLSALTPNMKGLENALSVNVTEIAVFTSCSETFCLRNTNCTLSASLEGYKRVCSNAREKGVRVRGYLSCAWGCPYEGHMDPARVADIAARLLNMGCYEVALGDTIGAATPATTAAVLSAVTSTQYASPIKRKGGSAQRLIPVEKVAVHFHDTHGMALRNILVALQFGITSMDSSVAGLGGCPYAGGSAAGNVATETVVRVLQSELGIDCGVEEDKLQNIVGFIRDKIKQEFKS